VTPSDIGFRKPDPHLFSFALRECCGTAKEVLFLGNPLNSDSKGADACGIRSILLKGAAYRSRDDVFDPFTNPTFRIEHWLDLPKLLAWLQAQGAGLSTPGPLE
jgi:FMN phosphatase YigB (HAD superfamily)